MVPPHGPYSVVAVRQRRIGDGGVDADRSGLYALVESWLDASPVLLVVNCREDAPRDGVEDDEDGEAQRHVVGGLVHGRKHKRGRPR